MRVVSLTVPDILPKETGMCCAPSSVHPSSVEMCLGPELSSGAGGRSTVLRQSGGFAKRSALSCGLLWQGGGSVRM